jgi:hypothetical protein
MSCTTSWLAGALEVLGADDVVHYQLAGGGPEHAGQAVQYQQQAGVPDLEAAAQKEQSPGQ